MASDVSDEKKKEKVEGREHYTAGTIYKLYPDTQSRNPACHGSLIIYMADRPSGQHVASDFVIVLVNELCIRRLHLVIYTSYTKLYL